MNHIRVTLSSSKVEDALRFQGNQTVDAQGACPTNSIACRGIVPTFIISFAICSVNTSLLFVIPIQYRLIGYHPLSPLVRYGRYLILIKLKCTVDPWACALPIYNEVYINHAQEQRNLYSHIYIAKWASRVHVRIYELFHGRDTHEWSTKTWTLLCRQRCRKYWEFLVLRASYRGPISHWEIDSILRVTHSLINNVIMNENLRQIYQ